MISSVSPRYNVPDPDAEEGDTENRSIGQGIVDEGAQALGTVVGWGRTVTNAARSAEEAIRGGPATIMGPVDRGVAEVQQYLSDGAQSKRAEALGEAKWFPRYGERSAWDAPLATAIHQISPMLPHIALGGWGAARAVAAKAVGNVARGIGINAGLNAFEGVFGAGDSLNKMRDYIDQTPIEEMKKLEPFQNALREFSGDEQAARTALFQRSVDWIALLTDAGANMLNFGVIQHALSRMVPGDVKRPVLNMIGRTLFGGAEGAAGGFVEGAADEFVNQRMLTAIGKQGAVDTGAIMSSGMEAMPPMAGFAAGAHAVRRRAEAKPKANTTTGGVGQGEIDTLDQQLNADNTAAPPPGGPPDSTRIDPDLKNSVLAQQQSQGYADLANARGLTPPAAPPAAPAPPAAGGAISTGAPPAQAPTQPVQPQVTVTPPAPAAPPRTRTPPVTPAPTATAAPAAPPAAPPAQPAGDRVVWDGQPGTLTTETPRMLDGVVFMRVQLDDGALRWLPANELEREAAPTAVGPAAATSEVAQPGESPAPATALNTAAPGVLTDEAKAQIAKATGSEDFDAIATLYGLTDEQVDDYWNQLADEDAAARKAQASPPVAAAPVVPSTAIDTRAPTPAPDWVDDMAKASVDKATRLGLIDRIRELSKTKTAKEISQALNGVLEPQEVRFVRDSLGIEALGPAGGFLANIPGTAPVAQASPPVAPAPVAPVQVPPAAPTAPAASPAPAATPPAALPSVTGKGLAKIAEVTAKHATPPVAPVTPVVAQVVPRETPSQKVTNVPHGVPKVPNVTARSLKQGDVVTTQDGRTYEVLRRIQRERFPNDPHLLIKFSDSANPEQRVAHELDEANPAESAKRAPAPTRVTKAGQPFQKKQTGPRFPLAPETTGNKLPAPGRPGYSQFIGTNADGEELWQNPTTGLRLAQRALNGVEAKRKALSVNPEDALVKKATEDKVDYQRSSRFVPVGGEAPAQKKPIVRKVVGVPEVDKPVVGPRSTLVLKKTAEQQALDEEIERDLKKREREIAEMGPRPITTALLPFEEHQPTNLGYRLNPVVKPEPGRVLRLKPKEGPDVQDERQADVTGFVPRAPEAHGPKTDAQEFDEHVQTLSRMRGLSRENFFLHKGVLAALDRMRELNVIRNRNGENLFILPQWAADKLTEGSEPHAYHSLIEHEAALAYAEAKKVADLPVEDITDEQAARFTAASKAYDKLIAQRVASAQQQTDFANRRLTGVTPVLKERIAKEMERTNAPGSLTEYILKAAQHIGEVMRLENISADSANTRDAQYAQREGRADYAFRKALKDMFSGADGKLDRDALDKFLRDLQGVGDFRVATRRVFNEATGEFEDRKVKTWRSLEMPPRPAILDRGPAVARDMRDFGGTTATKEIVDEEIARVKRANREFDRAQKEYDKAYDYWATAVGNQFSAAAQLQTLLDNAISETRRLFKEFEAQRTKQGKKTSVKFELPEGTKNADTGYTRYTISKLDKQFDNYNFVVSMMNLQDKLMIDSAAMRARFKGDRMGWKDNVAPTTQYLSKITRAMQNFALDLTNFVNGDMDTLRETRVSRSNEVTEGFKGVKDLVRDEEGQAVTRDPNTVLGARSVTSQESETPFTEAIHDKVDRETQRQEKPATSPKRQNMTFDVHGLPVEGKRRVEFQPYVEDEVDHAHEKLQGPDVNHPLIDPPLSTRAVLDKVWELIRRNAQGNVVSRAITPRFLDQLARITSDTQVVRAPYDVVSAAAVDAPAYYVADHDRVVMPNDATDEFFTRTAVHELTHAALRGAYETDAEFRQGVDTLLAQARAYAERTGMLPKGYDYDTESTDAGAHRLPGQLYGLKNAGEFLAETKSQEAFRQLLARVTTREPTIGDKVKNVLNAAYQKIQQAFRKLFRSKIDGDTALDVLFYDQSTVLGQTDKIVGRKFNQLERDGVMPNRMRYEPGVRSFMQHPAAGTEYVEQSLNRNLRSYAGRTLSETVDKARQLRGMNKAAGLPLHTMYDMGQRTNDPEFHDRFHDVMIAVAKKQAEAVRIMNEEDAPVLDRVGKFLRGLAPAHRRRVQEAFNQFNYHTAFPDAPLGERDAAGKLIGKNAHIDPDALANAQIVQEHPAMQKLWQDIHKIPGLVKLADDTWGFYKKREAQIRSLYVRTMAQLDGMLPDTLKPGTKAYDAALDALEKHLGDKATRDSLTPAEKAALASVDLANPRFEAKAADIRETARELAGAEGPYLPMVRNGDYAVSGTFHLPHGPDAERIEVTDRRNGKTKDSGIRVLKSEAAARAYVKRITREFGVSQLDGGKWYYDPATGKRLMTYTEEDLKKINDAKEKGEEPQTNRPASEATVKEMIEQNRPVEERFWVKFSPHLMEKHESLYDARMSTQRWREGYGDKLSVTPPEQARKGMSTQSEQYVSDTLQKLINRFKASEAYGVLDKHERAGLTEQLVYLSQKAVMHRGVRQRYLPRNFVQGANIDMARALADYSGGTASWMAKQKLAPELTRAWTKLDDYVESRRYEHGDRDAYARSKIRDALGERIHRQAEPMVDNMLNRWTDRLIRWTMLDKLPGLGYFTANATESALLGAPLQMGRHSVMQVLAAHRYAYRIAAPLQTIAGGIADTGRALAGRTVRRNYKQEFLNRVQKDKYGAGILQLIDFMSSTGQYDHQVGLEYQHRIGGRSHLIDKPADYLANAFQAANSSIENFSRMAVAISSYKLERDRLGDTPEAHDKAMRYAWDILNRASGIYSNYNAPELFTKGPLARLAFEFKKYPQRIMSNYINAAMGALRVFDKEARNNPEEWQKIKESGRQFAAMLVMQGLAAGALGLPTELFSVPVNALHIAGVVPYNWEDAKAGFRVWADKQFGHGAGDLISYGALRATGLDFHAKLSQSDMIFFGSPQSIKAQELRGPVLGILAGAGGGFVFDLVTGIQKAAAAMKAYSDGNYTMGNRLSAESARLTIPFRALTDFIDASTMSTREGRQTLSGRPRGEPLSDVEFAARAMGFNPVRVAQEQEKSRALQRLTQTYKSERARLTEEFVTGNPAERAAVWARIQQWNRVQGPGLELTYGQLIKAAGSRVKAQAQPKGWAGVALDKRGKIIAEQLEGVYD